MSEEAVKQALAAIQDDYLGKPLVDFFQGMDGSSSEKKVSLVFPYPFAGRKAELEAQWSEQVSQVSGSPLQIHCSWSVRPSPHQAGVKSIERVKYVVAVASGKGGVGKSTTSVNLALALAAEGATVGLLDADIYGPSQPMMLGIPEGTRPEVLDQQHFLPIEAHGIFSMSMGYMVTEKTPMVWRGPMVSGALQQLVNQTLWPELDYLLIDMPPGTGDIQLTLAQTIPVSGSVIVTTPQDIALLDAKKGIEMFRKVNINVLGVVENMALHTCSNCGHSEHIFGEGGGQRIADEYESKLLGSLPLTLKIREQADSGKPTVIAEPDSSESLVYREIARKMAAELSQAGAEIVKVFPNVKVQDD